MHTKMNLHKVFSYFLIAWLILFSINSNAQGKKITTKNSKTNAVTNADANTNINIDNAYTEEKSNISVTMDEPTFLIKLKSNPTTGYGWFLREYDSNLIIPVKHFYQAVERKTKLIGAPGFEVWVFKVKPNAFAVPQITSLRFIYARPWKSSDTSTQVVFHVSTQGK